MHLIWPFIKVSIRCSNWLSELVPPLFPQVISAMHTHAHTYLLAHLYMWLNTKENLLDFQSSPLWINHNYHLSNHLASAHPHESSQIQICPVSCSLHCEERITTGRSYFCCKYQADLFAICKQGRGNKCYCFSHQSQYPNQARSTQTASFHFCYHERNTKWTPGQSTL